MYAKSSNLLNGQFFYITENSIYIFKEDFNNGNWICYLTEPQRMNITNNEELELVSFAQYLDELSYNIIIIKHYLFFMDTTGSYLCTFELSQLSGYNINLVPYKCEEENSILKCYYFIAVINSDKKIEIYEYKATPVSNNCENELITNLTYTPVNSEKATTTSSCNYLSCQIMYYCKEYLSCFYENTSPNEIVAVSFDITNGLSISKNIAFQNNNGCQMIEAVVSLNKTKSFVCYIENDNEGHCVFYDIEKNKFENDEKYFDKCIVRRSLFENKYYRWKKEILLSCFSSLNEYQLKRFDKNFNLIEFGDNDYCNITISISRFGCDEIGYPSMLYLPSYERYVLMSTCNNDKTDLNNKGYVDDFCNVNFNYSVDDSFDEIQKICMEEEKEEFEEETEEKIEYIKEKEKEQKKEKEEIIEKFEEKIEEKANEEEKINKYEEKIENIEEKINEKEELTNYEEEIIESDIEKICTNEEIIKSLCKNISITNKQIEEIYNIIIDEILKSNESVKNTIIETKNAIIQSSKLDDQKNQENSNISNVDLGECEILLKKEYGISNDESLIIIKTDIKINDSISTYVYYRIFNPINLEPLDLKYCLNYTINVKVPINLDVETENLFNSLSESGYNLFDSSDSFYSDICTPYTTKNGTDIILEDRKKDIYKNKGNISFCQTGCEFTSYNATTKKAQCQCPISEKEVSNLNNITFSPNKLANSFLDTLKNSNFLVMKCYKLVFSKKGETNNFGSYIMIALIVTVLLCLILYCYKGPKDIKNLIDTEIKYKKNIANNENYIMPNKNISNFNKKFTKSSLIRNKKSKSIDFSNVFKNNNKTHINKNNIQNKKNKNLNNNNKNSENKDKNVSSICIKKENNNEPPKKIIKNGFKYSKNSHKSFNISNNSKDYLANIKQIEQKNKLVTKKINQNVNLIENGFSIYKTPFKKIKKNNSSLNKSINIKKFKKNNNYLINLKLNDEELNSLTYNQAIELDKRTYCQYYWALLKKKHFILFTFIATTDFNLRILKIALFIASFSLYFAINGFFFTDSTMHKVYKDNGAFNFIYQIPQILYSTVVSSVINLILKQLSLSEKDIIQIRKENLKMAITLSKKLKNCLLIKFNIFFSLNILLMIFFWYFIACFCAVYRNTQFILIKDTLVSFGLSMLYPFGLNLLPGFFRIPALRAKRRNKYYFYKFSELLAFL